MLLHKGGLSREGTLIHFHIKTLGEEKQVSEGEVFYRQDTDNVIMSHLDENTVHWEGIAVLELCHIPHHQFCQWQFLCTAITPDRKPRLED